MRTRQHRPWHRRNHSHRSGPFERARFLLGVRCAVSNEILWWAFESQSFQIMLIFCFVLHSCFFESCHCLVVSTHLKNISQIGSLPQIGVKIKNVWNHHLVSVISKTASWSFFWRGGSSIFKPSAESSIPSLLKPSPNTRSWLLVTQHCIPTKKLVHPRSLT